MGVHRRCLWDSLRFEVDVAKASIIFKNNSLTKSHTKHQQHVNIGWFIIAHLKAEANLNHNWSQLMQQKASQQRNTRRMQLVTWSTSISMAQNCSSCEVSLKSDRNYELTLWVWLEIWRRKASGARRKLSFEHKIVACFTTNVKIIVILTRRATQIELKDESLHGRLDYSFPLVSSSVFLKLFIDL